MINIRSKFSDDELDIINFLFENPEVLDYPCIRELTDKEVPGMLKKLYNQTKIKVLMKEMEELRYKKAEAKVKLNLYTDKLLEAKEELERRLK